MPFESKIKTIEWLGESVKMIEDDRSDKNSLFF